MALAKTFRGRWIVIGQNAINQGWEQRTARSCCPLAKGFFQSGLFRGVSVDVTTVLVSPINRANDIEFTLAGKAKEFYHTKVLGTDPPIPGLPVEVGDISKPQPFAFYIPKRGNIISRVRLERRR